ncbi:MAG: response regulator transcription factor [Eggerthellales bacterium]|nr:response regulator transcription factor [Eggerthellales bacterium]
MTRVLVVEDQAMLRESLCTTINAQPDMEIVGSLSDASQSIAAAKKNKPDVILMDVCTEHDQSGIVAAGKIKETCPDIKIIIMTGMPEITFVQQAKDAGVDSFMYKNVGTDELLAIIRSTMEGYTTFPRAQQGIFGGSAALSEIEIDILRLVCETKSRKEIAAELFLSEGTVKRHISDILAKTGHSNILKLAVHAVSNGYIVPRMNGKE